MSEQQPALRRVTYVSRALATGREDLESILRAARRNNAAMGVTGAMMLSGRHFAQVLEGPPDAVDEIFERIQMDDRHTQVSVLEVTAPPTRAFEAWTMGFVEDLGTFEAAMEDAAAAPVLIERLRNALTNSALAEGTR